MLSVPFPYFPAFVELVADGGSSLVVLTYSVNNAYSRVQIGTRLTHSVISVSWTCMLFHTSFVKWSRGSEASLRERWCSWLPSGRILKRLLPCELCIELKLILYRYEGRIERWQLSLIPRVIENEGWKCQLERHLVVILSRQCLLGRCCLLFNQEWRLWKSRVNWKSKSRVEVRQLTVVTCHTFHKKATWGFLWVAVF
jgi:hypothetical protein